MRLEKVGTKAGIGALAGEGLASMAVLELL